MPVPNKDAAGMDPSASVQTESNGVNCNTGPYELNGLLVDGAGLVCLLDEGKTKGIKQGLFGFPAKS